MKKLKLEVNIMGSLIIGLTSAHSAANSTNLSSKHKYSLLQICLAYSCTTYQQMFDGLSGSSLNTMKITTLSLTSQQYRFVILSKQVIFLALKAKP
ncbi:hypothetical protein BgiMline_024933 [Biomphalaria glabrata]